MHTEPIYIVHSDSKIEALYTLFPLIVSRYVNLLRFVPINSRQAQKITGHSVVLVRAFKGNDAFAQNDEKKRAYVQDFRKRFDRVVMLDDGAGSDSLHYEYMDLVDIYFKGKLLRDQKAYLEPSYGRQPFTDYYHRQYGITDEKEKWRTPPTDPALLSKLRLSWNLGYGVYPVPAKNLVRMARLATRMGWVKILKPSFDRAYRSLLHSTAAPVAIANKQRVVQARFGYRSFPNTVGYQRRLMLEGTAGNKLLLAGKVPPDVYQQEIQQVGAVLSPFGWGEVCFRDFEAVAAGALLIKPDMSHLETWPDIYQSGITYQPVDWDGEQLNDVVALVTTNLEEYLPMIQAARQAYHQSLLQLEDRVVRFLEITTGMPIGGHVPVPAFTAAEV